MKHTRIAPARAARVCFFVLYLIMIYSVSGSDGTFSALVCTQAASVNRITAEKKIMDNFFIAKPPLNYSDVYYFA